MKNDSGVYQKKNGYWEYRFAIRVGGKRIEKKKSTDSLGNKLRTKREAIAARDEAIVQLRTERTQKPKTIRRTVREVFDEFCESGRKDRAYGLSATIIINHA